MIKDEFQQRDCFAVCALLQVDPSKGLSSKEALARHEKIQRQERLPRHIVKNYFQRNTHSNGVALCFVFLFLVTFAASIVEGNIPLLCNITGLTVCSVVHIACYIVVRFEMIKKFCRASQDDSHATVFRNSKWETISVQELVPGDIISLNAKQTAPADILLFPPTDDFSAGVGAGNKNGDNILYMWTERPSPSESKVAERGVVLRTGNTTKLLSTNWGTACLQKKLEGISFVEKYRAVLIIINSTSAAFLLLAFIRRFKAQSSIVTLWSVVVFFLVFITASLSVFATLLMHHFVWQSFLCVAQWEKYVAGATSFKCNNITRVAQRLGECDAISIEDELLFGEMLSLNAITFKKNGEALAYEWVKSAVYSSPKNVLTKYAVRNDEKLEMLLTILVLFGSAISGSAPLAEPAPDTVFFLLKDIVNQLLSFPSTDACFVPAFAREKEELWKPEQLLSLENGLRGLLVSSARVCHLSQCLFVGGRPEPVLAACSRIMLENGQVKDLDSDLCRKILSKIESMQQCRTQCIALAFKPVRNFQKKTLGNSLTFVGLCGVVYKPHPYDALLIENIGKSGIHINTTAEKEETCRTANTNVSELLARQQVSVYVRKMRARSSQGRNVEIEACERKVTIYCEQLEDATRTLFESRALLANLKQMYKFLLRSSCCQIVCIVAPVLLGIPLIVTPLQFTLSNMLRSVLLIPSLGRSRLQNTKKDATTFNWSDFFADIFFGAGAGGAAVAAFVWWFLSSGFEWSDFSSVATCVDTVSWKCFVLANPVGARSLGLATCTALDTMSILRTLSRNGSVALLCPTKNITLIFASAVCFFCQAILPQCSFFHQILFAEPASLHGKQLTIEKWNTVQLSFSELCKFLMVFSFPLVCVEEVFKIFSLLWCAK